MCGKLIQGFLLIHNILVSLFSHLYSVLGKILSNIYIIVQYNIQRLYNVQNILYLYFIENLPSAEPGTTSHIKLRDLTAMYGILLPQFQRQSVISLRTELSGKPSPAWRPWSEYSWQCNTNI